MAENELTISEESVKNKIFIIREVQVMLDSDLALLYNVETKQLNRAVKRNKDRFPINFCFQLNEEEYNILRSQIVTLEEESLRFQTGTLNITRGKHRKYLPYVFTEQGEILMGK